MIPSKRVMQYTLFLAASISLFISSEERIVFAQTNSLSQSGVLVGDDLKNNPLAQKILSEIESFKKHVIRIEQNQVAMDLSAMQVEQQRELAGQLQQEAIASLDEQNAQHTPKAAFANFVSSVNDTTAQSIFWGEFDYMSQKVDDGNAAMKQVLDNGGTYDQAIQEFSKYAAITRAEMVRANEDLNIQYGAADPSVQRNFDSNGMLPADYIKKP